MYRKLAVAFFLVVTLMAASWLGSAAAAEKEHENREAQIHQTREKIQKIKAALERDQTEGNIKELQHALKQSNQKLERLMAGEREPKKRNVDRETQIHNLQGQMKELRSALEHNPDSEKAGKWRESLAESEKKLERLTAEGEGHSTHRRGPRGKLITGHVISGTREDVTIKTLEAGKVMVLRVPMRRREDGKWVKNTNLARITAGLKKERLVLARYNEGEEAGAYFLQRIRYISFPSDEQRKKSRYERREKSRPKAKQGSLESLNARIDRVLEKLEGVR